MLKIFKITVVISILLFLGSCKTVDMILHPNRYIERDSPREKEYIYDTIRISNNQGQIEDAVAGFKPQKQLIFTKIGQSYNFKSGESIEIISDGVDFSNTTFDIETDENTKEIKLKLIDKDISKVYLDKKCQTIIRTGIDFVPKVEVAKGLDPEQIIITPIFDNACNKMGYEIRYGSSESGCRKEAKKVLDDFKRCTNTTTPPPPPPPPPKCRLKRKLGIPCN